MQKLAMIVRGADSPNKDLTPESKRLDSISHGFRRLMLEEGYDDSESIRRQWPLYNGLYLFCGGDISALRTAL